MNKKKIVLIFIVIIVFSLLGIMIYNNLTNYSNVLKANWNIKLPKNSIKKIYSANSDLSFHGDGIRYHIFSYKNEDKIKKLFNWSNEEKETVYYSSYSESVNNWLNKIKVSKKIILIILIVSIGIINKMIIVRLLFFGIVKKINCILLNHFYKIKRLLSKLMSTLKGCISKINNLFYIY